MKYIDAEKLIAEIEKIRNQSAKILGDAFVEGDIQKVQSSSGVVWACENILSYIASLQQEQPEVDLAEEITRFFSKNPIPYEHITDWPLLKNTAIHFYELGLNARKEE